MKKLEKIKTEKDLDEKERQQLIKIHDKRKLIRETLVEIKSIKPAGHHGKNLLVLPIGKNKFIYNVCNEKGIAKAEPNYEHGRDPTWIIKIKGTELKIENKPLDESELIFNLPDEKEIDLYLKGKTKALETIDLYDELKKYYKRFVDLNNESYYEGLILFTFQTWLIPILDSAFFLAITGQFGGGKTVILETVKAVSKHGYIPNPSVSFIGRCMEKMKISLFIDEFDIMGEKDNDLYLMVRTCQRRGQAFTRMAEKGQKIESFNTFGPCSFTVHGGIEDALQTRSVVIYTSESEKKYLGKLGDIRRIMGNKLYNKMFLWFVENFVDIYNDYLQLVNDKEELIDNLTEDDEENSKLLNKVLYGIDEVSEYTGRNSELEQAMLMVLRFTGLIYKENLTKAVNGLLKLKEELREEMRETGVAGYLRNFLVKFYTRRRKDVKYRTDEGFFMGSNMELNKGFTEYMKNQGYPKLVGTAEYRGIMRDFGFITGKNQKRMRVWVPENNEKKNVTAYIFDDRVQRTLGIKITNMLPTEGATFGSKYDEKEINSFDVK